MMMMSVNITSHPTALTLAAAGGTHTSGCSATGASYGTPRSGDGRNDDDEHEYHIAPDRAYIGGGRRHAHKRCVTKGC